VDWYRDDVNGNDRQALYGIVFLSDGFSAHSLRPIELATALDRRYDRRYPIQVGRQT